jgi:hypothetical protein
MLTLRRMYAGKRKENNAMTRQEKNLDGELH